MRTRGFFFIPLSFQQGPVLVTVLVLLLSLTLASCNGGSGNNAREDSSQGSSTIGSTGGQVQGPGGLVVTFQPGTFTTPVSVRITDVSLDSLSNKVTASLEQTDMLVLFAFHLDTGEVALQTSADFTIPNTFGLPPGQAIIVQVLPDTSATPVVLVETARITDNSISTTSPPFPGIRDNATFIVLASNPSVGVQTPVFASGRVSFNGLPVAEALVQSLNSPFPSVSKADGSYVTHVGFLQNISAFTTIIAQEAVLSFAGSIVTDLTMQQALVVDGAIIIPVPGDIILEPLPDSFELDDIENEIKRHIAACVACEGPIKQRGELLAEEIEAAAKDASSQLRFPFSTPLVLQVDQTKSFKSDPITTPTFEFDPKVQLPEICETTGVRANLKYNVYFEIGLVSDNPFHVVPPIASVVGQPALNRLSRRSWELDVTLRGEDIGTGVLVGSLGITQLFLTPSFIETERLKKVEISCPYEIPLEGSIDSFEVGAEVRVKGCGDGEIGENEVCDGNNLGGKTCPDFGFDSGALACSADCKSFDLSGCRSEGLQCSGPPGFEICAEIWVLSGNLLQLEPSGEPTEICPLSFPFIKSAEILLVPLMPCEGLSCTKVCNVTTRGPAPSPPTIVGGFVDNNSACLGVALVDEPIPDFTISFGVEGMVQGNLINGVAEGTIIAFPCNYSGTVSIQRAPSALK
jgi:hypothetical protein